MTPGPSAQGLGVLKSGLISVGSKRAEEPDPLDPEIIKRFDNHFRYDNIADDFYQDEDGDETHLQRILHWYQDYFGSSSGGGASDGARLSRMSLRQSSSSLTCPARRK